MSNLVHNEQMKLAANLFNNLGVVCLASGFLTPMFSSSSIGEVGALGSATLGIAGCFVAVITAHSFLIKLKE
jgi:hypothetical protein